MKRRDFIIGAGILAATAGVPSKSVADDAVALKKAIADVYSTFSNELDKQKYRSLVTEDYLLLEQGKILDIEGDLALMPTSDSGYKRTDTFDFRSVKVHGDMAYLVYFLKSQITDKDGTRNREWLESAIFRRSGTRWLMALLHSTRTTEPST